MTDPYLPSWPRKKSVETVVGLGGGEPEIFENRISSVHAQL